MTKKCFVIMPFKETFDSIWENIIKPTVENHGDICLRADDIFAPGSIINDIVHSIYQADYIIADLTDQNTNVYYELGFAHGLKKPVVLLTQDISTLPFDIRHQRVIEYADTSAGAIKLRNTLGLFLKNILT